MLLARLGLRGAEAAALRLRDVAWHDGDLLIRGKGSAVERIPLPAAAGEALAAYLMGGRPACLCPAHTGSGTAWPPACCGPAPR